MNQDARTVYFEGMDWHTTNNEVEGKYCLDCDFFELWTLAAGGGGFKVHIKSRTPLSDCAPMLEGLNVVKKEIDEFKAMRKAEFEKHPECGGTINSLSIQKLLRIFLQRNSKKL